MPTQITAGVDYNLVYLRYITMIPIDCKMTNFIIHLLC